jgi:hypothetical protein
MEVVFLSWQTTIDIAVPETNMPILAPNTPFLLFLLFFCLHVHFAANNQKLPFSVSSVLRVCMFVCVCSLLLTHPFWLFVSFFCIYFHLVNVRFPFIFSLSYCLFRFFISLFQMTLPSKRGRGFVCVGSQILLNNSHRWACLLKNQLSITVYRLMNKEKKLPFSVSVCRTETEVYLFHFLFAANKRKLAFQLVVFFVCLWVCAYLSLFCKHFHLVNVHFPLSFHFLTVSFLFFILYIFSQMSLPSKRGKGVSFTYDLKFH